MISKTVKKAAAANDLHILDTSLPEGIERSDVAMGGGIGLPGVHLVVSGVHTVGRVYELGNGKFAAVPVNFPTKVGTAKECFDFLAMYRDCQTFPVVVRFAEPQDCVAEQNEVSVSAAVEKVSRRLVGAGGAISVSVAGVPAPTEEEWAAREKEREVGA
jgi:hypothetical protein